MVDHTHAGVGFPRGTDFLDLIEEIADAAGIASDEERGRSGEKYPQTLGNLGTVLSLLYQAACCNWGCRGGDHQAEWLIGRVCNQAMASYRLLRIGFYDESLMMTRGAGEIANLIWLFRETCEFDLWKTASRRDRMKNFGPAAVRDRLKRTVEIGPPISAERYRMLCEVGTHPVPWIGPNLFSGGTRPKLGHLVQTGGLLVASNELAFAVAMAAAPAAAFLNIVDPWADKLREAAVALVRSIGSLTILEHDELVAQAVKDAAEAATTPTTH